MGVWMNDEKDLVIELAETLDDIEGDFTQETLVKALEKLKEYPYVCDKEIDEKKWRKYLDGD